MASISPAAQSAALRLLTREREPKGLGAPADRLNSAEEVSRALASTLSRWFGPYGYHALLTRALADALLTHPELGTVRVQSPADPTLVGLGDAATAHGIDATMEAVTTVLATTVDLLVRLIGEEMAINLVEQAMPNVRPGGPKAQAEENLS